MKVTQIRVESELVKSYILAPVDDKPLMAFHPGQYISVAVNFPDGSRQLRQYSLSDAPSQPYYRISVKREMGGDIKPSGQVSNWLHDNVKVGDTISISPPYGDFKPQAKMDEPLVLMSAGVGITPMISTLNHLAQTHPQHPVIFAHAARSGSHHAHTADVANALEQMPNLRIVNFYETIQSGADGNVIQGEMQLSDIPEWDREKAKVYMCGPEGFMIKQWQQLLDAGVPRHNLHREVFGPGLLDNLTS
jgi:nitric oxide dioxygenase